MPLSFSDVARAAERFMANNPSRRLEVFLNPEDYRSLHLEYQWTPGAIPGQLINIGGFTLRCSNEVRPGMVYVVTPPEFVGTFPMREDLTFIPEGRAPSGLWDPRIQGWSTTPAGRDTSNATTRSLTIPEGNSTTLKPPPPKTLWERLMEDD